MARVLLCLVLALAFAAPARAAPAAPPTPDEQRGAWKQLYERPEDVPFPDENPYSEAKAKLGRVLFFDPVLSRTGMVSCASCHNPALSWGDGLPLSIGAEDKPLPLRSPTLLDVAWVPLLGWEGSYPDLEAMAFVPINSPHIMNRKTDDLLAALAAIPDYRKAFDAAFPDGKVSGDHIEMALATFERTIVTGEAPFDRWIAGDEQAISDAAKHGFDLFNGKAGCAECHSGWNFTDSAFYDIGTASGDDIGRARVFPNRTQAALCLQGADVARCRPARTLYA